VDSDWLVNIVATTKSASEYPSPNTPLEARIQRNQELLQKTQQLMDFVGHPENSFKSVHVAGTSGKGSTTTLIAQLLTACGFKVGHHVSPYVQFCNEKIQINQQMIAPSEFVLLVKDFRDLFERWKQSGGERLRHGEIWTLLCFLYFKKQKVDWAVVEAVMGGRFDPTNVLSPHVSVITNVELDHVTSLGPDLSQIAWHKAGIIKKNGVVVTAENKPDVLQVIREEAAKKNATLYQVKYTIHSSGTKLTVETPFHTFKDLELKLPKYQLHNTAVAITSVDILANLVGFSFDAQLIVNTLKNFVFPGRFEVMQRDPLVILDGAHNPHKMETLVDSLVTLYPNKDIRAIIGVIQSKDLEGILAPLIRISKEFVVTEPNIVGAPKFPQAMSAISDYIKKVDPSKPLQAKKNVKDAINYVLSEPCDKDAIVLITGSLYLVGEARVHWIIDDQVLHKLENDAILQKS